MPQVVAGGWPACKMTPVKQESSYIHLCSLHKLQAGSSLHEAPSASPRTHNLCVPYFSGWPQAMDQADDSKISDLSHVMFPDHEMLMGRTHVLKGEKNNQEFKKCQMAI